MSEPSIPMIPENDNETAGPPSPWVTLVSMLLLISLLILSSVMLMYYAMEQGGEDGKASLFSRFSVSSWVKASPRLSFFLAQGLERLRRCFGEGCGEEGYG